MGRLDDKVILITGGARGQGAAEAELFTREGAAVVITDVLDGSDTASATGATFHTHDVTSAADWQRVVDATIAEHGRIDALVNNAGVTADIRLADTTEEEFRRIVDINQFGVFHGMKTVSPHMLERKAGSIVNISSIAGMRASIGIGYGASKWAVRGMTKTAAMEFAFAGVRVNSVHPGSIRTPMFQELLDQGFGDQMTSEIPLGRLGEADEVAYLVLYLVSDESRYCTGSEFTIDGGVMAMGVRQR